MTKQNGKFQAYWSITPEEARELMSGSSWVLVDVRDPEEYEQWHLEGAISLPGVELTTQAAKRLPDQDVPIIVYCDTGGRSLVAAQILAALGYTHVYDLGGRPCPLDICNSDPE